MWASGGSCGGLVILLHLVGGSRLPIGSGCQLAWTIGIVLACKYSILAFSDIYAERLLIVDGGTWSYRLLRTWYLLFLIFNLQQVFIEAVHS